MAVCKHAYYWGRVQGVGFRYTVARLAEGYAVAGFVRNLPDGQVEMVVEGKQEDVEQLLTSIAGKMAGFIRGQSVQDETPQGFERFEIRA